MYLHPQIIISRDETGQVLTANRYDHPGVHRQLDQLGFHRIPGTQLYRLAQAEDQPISRAREAAAALRQQGYRVLSDPAIDPHVQAAQPRTGAVELISRLRRQQLPQAPRTVSDHTTAHARALQADIDAGRITVLDELDDADGTRRALAVDNLSGEGVLLYDADDQRYVELRLDSLQQADYAFGYARGNGRYMPPPPHVQNAIRAQRAAAARAASPGVARAPALPTAAAPPAAANGPPPPQPPHRRSRR